MELVDRVDRLADHPQHQVGVAARADQRVGAQEVVLGEVGAGGGELALVLGALRGVEPAPRRVELQKGELDVVALLLGGGTPEVWRTPSGVGGRRALPASLRDDLAQRHRDRERAEDVQGGQRRSRWPRPTTFWSTTRTKTAIDMPSSAPRYFAEQPNTRSSECRGLHHVAHRLVRVHALVAELDDPEAGQEELHDDQQSE